MPSVGRCTCALCGETKLASGTRLVRSDLVGEKIRAHVTVLNSDRGSLQVNETLAARPFFAAGDRICLCCIRRYMNADLCVRVQCEILELASPGKCESCGTESDSRKNGLCPTCEGNAYQERMREKLAPDHTCPKCDKTPSERPNWRSDGICEPCHQKMNRKSSRDKLPLDHRCPRCGRTVSSRWRLRDGVCIVCVRKEPSKKRKRRPLPNDAPGPSFEDE